MNTTAHPAETGRSVRCATSIARTVIVVVAAKIARKRAKTRQRIRVPGTVECQDAREPTVCMPSLSSSVYEAWALPASHEGGKTGIRAGQQGLTTVMVDRGQPEVTRTGRGS